jgi:ribosome assembly protein YihI (activator of Der GTPase)
MNQKKRYRNLQRLSALCFFALCFVTGCGDKGKSGLTESELERIAIAEKIKLVEAEGGLVLMVGGEAVSSDEIIKAPVEFGKSYISPLEHFEPIAKTSSLAQFKERARGELKAIVFNKISQILLYQEAKRQAGPNIDESLEKVAEKEMRRFILRFGGDEAEADQALKKIGMDRKKFKERQKKFILTQSYIASKLPRYRPPTYQELLDRYDQMKDKSFFKPGIIQFRLIDIEVAKVDITEPNQTSASSSTLSSLPNDSVEPNRLEEAKKLASQLLSRIKAGEDFAALAQQFSHGHRREFGGLWQPIQPESLASPYDILASEAEKIQPGQVAGPIETPEHIFIMKLEEKQPAGYEPFEKVQTQIEDRIFNEHRNEVIDKLNDRLLEQTELGKTDEFVDFCLERIYRLSKQ